MQVVLFVKLLAVTFAGSNPVAEGTLCSYRIAAKSTLGSPTFRRHGTLFFPQAEGALQERGKWMMIACRQTNE